MRKYSVFLLLVLSLVSCSEFEKGPIELDSTPPAPVSNVVVQNISGGAIVTFDLPNEKDILCVEAQYKLTNGEIYKTRSSFLKNNIRIEGYLGTTEQTIALYAVDRSENYSDATNVKIKPEIPPVQKVMESIKITPDFGGLTLNWENDEENPIAIIVSKTINDTTTIADTYYSKTKTGSFAIRGLDTLQYKFDVVVRDKWMNFSDTITQTFAPLYETELDYAGFKIMDAAFTNNLFGAQANLVGWWDDKTQDNHPTGDKVAIPWDGSIDLGAKVKLSRLVIWQYAWSFNNFGHYYSGVNAEKYEIYGSNTPNPSGELDESWVFIMDTHITKPSGLPNDTYENGMTDEDYDLAKNRGHEFIVPLKTEAYRYIRFRCTKNFSGNLQLGNSSEVDFFGDPRY
jgi:hypothetical protein